MFWINRNSLLSSIKAKYCSQNQKQQIDHYQHRRKNMFVFSAVLVVVNLLFLVLGAVLCFYAAQKGITIDPKHTDDLFPNVALNYLGTMAGLIFIIGLIS